MDLQLKAQLNQLVRIGVAGSLDAYGDPSLSGSTTLYARVEEHNRLYEFPDRETVRTSHMCILDNDAVTPTYSGWIWLPGQSSSTLTSDGRHPKIIRPCPAEDGSLDHWEVIV